MAPEVILLGLGGSNMEQIMVRRYTNSVQMYNFPLTNTPTKYQSTLYLLYIPKVKMFYLFR